MIEIKKRMQCHMDEYINDIKVAYTIPLAYNSMWIEWNISNLKSVGAIECITTYQKQMLLTIPKNSPFRANRAKVLDFSYHITWSHRQVSRAHTQPYVILQIHKDTQVYTLIFNVLKIKSEFSKIEWRIVKKMRHSIHSIEWNGHAKKNYYNFFSQKEKSIDDMIERTHTKLTEMYDTTYYINVQTIRKKTHFYQLKICLEARARVCVWRFFFYCRSHDSIWFIRARYLCSCTPFDFSLNDTWWCHTMRARIIPNNEIRSRMPSMRKRNDTTCDIRQTNLNIVVQVVFITTEYDSTLFVWLKKTQSKSVFEIFSWSADSNFAIDWYLKLHIKWRKPRRNRNVISYETGIEYQLILRNHDEKRRPHTWKSTKPHSN